ncbi:MAG: DNA repair and recombination protein RadA [Candidatus Njordarchaeia archaeon]
MPKKSTKKEEVKQSVEAVEEKTKIDEKTWKQNVIKELSSLPGIGKTIAARLFNSGYTTLRLIAVTPPRVLSSEIGIGEKTAENLVQAARQIIGLEFATALDFMKSRKDVKHITTGSRSLDELLGGGIETQGTTEFYGEYRTGKTQICHTVSVTVQLPEEDGGLEGKALYIDTEGTFRPERILPIAKRFGLDPDEALRNIIVSRVFSTDHQIEVVRKAKKLIPTEDIKLLVVDSLTNHFRAEYVGIDTLASRQQKLNIHLHDLNRIAYAFNIAVIVTNQVVTNPGIFFGNPTQAIGGNIVAHNITTRVYLRKGKGSKRVARLEDSPYLPENEAVFEISDEGIIDTKESE